MDFCKQCGYKFSGQTFGLLQFVPPRRGHQAALEKQPHAEVAGVKIKENGAGMRKEEHPGLSDRSDRAHFTFHLANVLSQKWGVFAGSMILSLIAAIIYCTVIHCA